MMKIRLKTLEIKSFITDAKPLDLETVKGGDRPVETLAIVCNATMNTCAVICNPPQTNERICFTQNMIYCGH